MASTRGREAGKIIVRMLAAKRSGAEEVIRGEGAVGSATAQSPPPTTVAHIYVVKKDCFPRLPQLTGDDGSFPAIGKLGRETDDMLESDGLKTAHPHPVGSFIGAIEVKLREFHQVNLAAFR